MPPKRSPLLLGTSCPWGLAPVADPKPVSTACPITFLKHRSGTRAGSGQGAGRGFGAQPGKKQGKGRSIRRLSGKTVQGHGKGQRRLSWGRGQTVEELGGPEPRAPGDAAIRAAQRRREFSGKAAARPGSKGTSSPGAWGWAPASGEPDAAVRRESLRGAGRPGAPQPRPRSAAEVASPGGCFLCLADGGRHPLFWITVLRR